MKIPLTYVLVVFSTKVFREVVCKILRAGMPDDVEVLQDFRLVGDPENRISIARDRCFLTVSLAIPTAVLLSQCTGVGGCSCPSSSRISQIVLPSWQFTKRAPSSASAADATTNFNIPL